MMFILIVSLSAGLQTPPPIVNDTNAAAQAGIRTTLDAAMAAISKRDPESLRPLLRPFGTFTVMEVNSDGTRRLTSGDWNAYLDAMKAAPENVEERLHDVEMRIDGTVADVWAPYTLLLDGTLRNCGIDHFQFVLDGGRWKIQNVTWTERTMGCQSE